jgi:hypothetical protein
MAALSERMAAFLPYFPAEWGEPPRYCPAPTWTALHRRGLFEVRHVERPDPTGRFAPSRVAEVRLTEAGKAEVARLAGRP